MLDAPDGRDVDPRCREAAIDTAALCEQLGHHVEEATPRYDVETLVRFLKNDYLGAPGAASVAVSGARKKGE